MNNQRPKLINMARKSLPQLKHLQYHQNNAVGTQI